ncbi:hypothetical protein NUU61_005738 [Penicillium alfredii]|uniref:Zn(2)-C6 fungal-type domain-containing protein n=1 Tax=Penicillium alfredii TaxID=1506179 RepID=A0A9W9FAG2_9EURO|nr:uncharacterized protein NUU61_005738 [Penicillium alfredii]KAJ5096382.1 hypothetical protein NUU61_005738 [Penicillium alfredii]
MELDPQLRASRDGDTRRSSYMPSRPLVNPVPGYPAPPQYFPPGGHQARDTSALEPGPTYADPSSDPENPLADLKRARACEPCRQLKVRCDPDPDHPDGSCKRCAKARRTCFVTAPTRKRQKKTDSRVAELERKIDALTATLQASHSNALFSAAPPADPPPSQPQPHDQHTSRRWLKEDSQQAGTKRQHGGQAKVPPQNLLGPQYSRPGSPSVEQLHDRRPPHHWRGPYSGAIEPPKTDAGNEFVDVIDRGIIDIETAVAAFNRFVNQMAEEMPVVMLHPETKMGDVRREKPALFLAITAAGVGVFNPNLQLSLFGELYRLIGDRVVVKGEKSLDLLQAILVGTLWYLPPDNFDEIKFWQLIHMAVALAMDLGLNRRTLTNKRPFTLVRDLMMKKPAVISFDPDGPEARRAWIGCYFLAVQAATALRRVLLVRWQPYNDECLEILENHPDALPSDRKLVWWAKLGLIMEEVGVHFSTDYPGSIITFADSKLRYTMKALENELFQWRRDIPEELYTETLANTEHTVNLFMHEPAMSVDCNTTTDADSPSSDSLAGPAVSAIIDGLTTCISSIHKALDSMCTVEIDRLLCLPTMWLGRTSYAMVSLIKIYSHLTPECRIGQIIDVESLKIEYYMDKVISHYRTGAARDGGRAVAKFGNILVLLRNWFIKKKDQGQALKDVFADPREAVPCGPPLMKPGTTPLHLLSEIATGEPTNRASSSGHAPNQASGPEYTSSTEPSSNRGVGATPTTRTNSYGAPDTPNSTAGHKAADTQTSWASDPSANFPSSFPGPLEMGNRGYYQSFNAADPSQPYPDLAASSNIPTQTQQTYPDMSSTASMQLSQPMGVVPEMGTETVFDPDNVFLFGSMMDEGLFSFPMSFGGNFGF